LCAGIGFQVQTYLVAGLLEVKMCSPWLAQGLSSSHQVHLKR
jgi:hypothetical protein